MLDNVIRLAIGNLNEKREYKELMKRVDALPKEYSFAFKKIQKYMYTVGASGGNINIFMDMTMFKDLVELFEISVADGRKIVDVIGNDAGNFSDEFMSAYRMDRGAMREKLNSEIMERFNKEGRS